MMDFKSLLRPYHDEALDNLRKWLQINSIHDETTIEKGAPFGKGVHDALYFIASLAKAKGFAVDLCDGYCVEIKWGSGQKLIDVYAHADVVPVSGTWKYPPFEAAIEDDILYGRGASDDKGPAMAAFYALLALKENNLIDDDYTVRLVIGGNEEKGSACLDYYFHQLNKGYPTYGFTPDGDFPLIYGEKGISNYETKVTINIPHVKSINAGVVSNSVIDKAEALLERIDNVEEYLAKKDYQYTIVKHDDSEYLLTIFGKAAHGSLPEQGINAGVQLLDVLGNAFDVSYLSDLAKAYQDVNGRNIDAYYYSELLHESTYNVGIITYEKGVLHMIVNFRYPENVEPQKVMRHLNSVLPGVTTLISSSQALCFDPKSPLVTNLLRVYQEETGDYETPIMTIGGGTYAKESRNTLAFGSAFPHSDDHIHEANEKIFLKDFFMSMPIYAHAIYTLGKETCE